MKRKELKAHLAKVITKKRAIYEDLKPNRDNPTVKELMSRTDAEIIAFMSVLDALNDNDALIRCY